MVRKKKEEVKAKDKVETKVPKEKKKYNSFQIGLITLLAIGIVILSTVLLVKEISALVEEKKLYNEFYEIYESDELSIIFYRRTGCIYCEMQEPILKQIAKDYNLKYFDIDNTKLSDKHKEEIEEELGLDGSTPVTLVVKNGEVIATNPGYVDGHRYVEFFVKAGVLKEGSEYLPEQNLTFIDYQEFLEITKSGKPVTVTLGRAACEYCTTARPILSNIAKAYDIPVYYITLNYISAEDRLALIEDLKRMEYTDEVFVEEGNLSTPATLIIENDKVVAFYSELGNINIYTKLFKDYGIIEK